MMNCVMKNKVKEAPSLQFVADSMELMSAAGRRRMMEQPWIVEADALRHEQQQVRAMVEAADDPRREKALTLLRHQLMQLHDLRTTLQSLRSRFLLSEVELFELKNLAFIGGKARQALAELGLAERYPLPDLGEVFALLDPDGIGTPNFYIYDSYDQRLAPLRRQMKQADETMMGELLARQNEIQQQVAASLCDRLLPWADMLTKAMEQMAYIDFALARAALAKQWGLAEPADGGEEEEGGYAWRLCGLFNPRLRQRNAEAGLRYQPVDMAFGQGATLITGANMAGKTVLLKSVGLAQLMYQFGFPIPAASGRLRPVDDVVFCIGDEQNEMNGLSSFASEITRISEVVERSRSERLLVLIDEPARTTNPIEGKALVQSLANVMESRQSATLITTHYSQLGLGVRRLRVRGFVESMADVALSADTINRFIDYSLVPDSSDEVPQEALRIAEMLCCQSELIEGARRFLGESASAV